MTTRARRCSIVGESAAIPLNVHRLMPEDLAPTNLVSKAVAPIVAEWEHALAA